MAVYRAWTASRSNEAFDRAQALALKLTEQDREAGREAPAFGYSGERFREAERIVRDAQTGDVEYAANPCPCVRANPEGGGLWVAALVVAAVGVVAYLTMKREPAANAAATQQKCPFPLDKAKLNQWLDANGLFGFFSPTCPPPKGYTELVKITNGTVNNVPPGTSIIAICEDTGDFWFYGGPGSTPVKRDDLRDAYCKSSGAVSGLAHPAAMFFP